MRDMDLKILEELATILPDQEPEPETEPEVTTNSVRRKKK